MKKTGAGSSPILPAPEKKGGNDEKNEVSFANERSFFQKRISLQSKEHTNNSEKIVQVISIRYKRLSGSVSGLCNKGDRNDYLFPQWLEDEPV